MIRPVTLADVDAYRQLRLDALQNHPTAFGQDYAEASSRPRSYWEEALTINDEEKAIFLAEHDRRLVGMTGIARRLSSKSMHSANIWGVYVSPEWRGKHIAGALIRSCLEWAKRRVLSWSSWVYWRTTSPLFDVTSAVDLRHTE